MIGELEKMANLNIPKDIASEEANKYLIDACAKYEVKCPPPLTTTRLLDKVSHFGYKEYIRDIFVPLAALPCSHTS